MTRRTMTLNILRWAARILGLLLAGLVLLITTGEGIDPSELTLTTGLMSVAFFAAIAGMLVLWRWELIGGMMVLVGMMVFYVINFAVSGKLPSGWVFPLCFMPGILALTCWRLTKRAK